MSLDIQEVDRLVGKGRKLVTFFHQSTSISDLLLEKQKLLFDANPTLIGHKLIIDVATRWSSTLYMLQRLNEQFPALMATANDPSLSKHAKTTLTNCLFSFEEHSTVENIVKILQPFEKATTIVCADKTPTMQKILPTVIKLVRTIQVSDEDAPIMRKIKDKMLLEINNRTSMDKITLLGCIMNPFTKDLNFKPELKEEATQYLREEVSEVREIIIKKERVEGEHDEPLLPQLVSPSKSNESLETTSADKPEESNDTQEPVKTVAKKMKSADTEDWLADVICTGETKKDPVLASESEIQRYLGITENDNTLTILEWWNRNEQFYPRISKVAKKIFISTCFFCIFRKGI